MSLAIPLTHLTELSDAEAGLTEALRGRDLHWAGGPSALPGWSRAHVVAHLCGNAAGLSNLVRWAATGVPAPMYPSSDERAAEIERRAQLPWERLLAETEQAALALRADLESLTEPVRARELLLGSGAPARVCDLAAVRVRELEVHRVDLADPDYTAASWSPLFRLRTLTELSAFFRAHRAVPVHVLRSDDTGSCWEVGGPGGPDLVGGEGDLLAWLLGRPYRDLHTSDGTEIPRAPTWV